MPSVRQLEYLVAVADLLHFGKAADECGVSQPTLSQQISALEKRLGAALIDRKGWAVQMTPLGRLVVERARRVLVEIQEIRSVARRSREKMVGVIRFGVTPTLGPYLMPSLIATLHAEQPDIKLYIREGLPTEQALELARGNLDMMIGPLPLIGEGLEIEPLFREPMHIVVPPHHPLAEKPTVTRHDLAGEAFLSLDPRHHYHRMVEGICDDLGAVILRDYEGTSLDSIQQMVGSGIGIAVLPELYLRSDVGGEALIRRVTPVDWQATRSIAAAWCRNAANSADFRLIAARVQAEAKRILSDH